MSCDSGTQSDNVPMFGMPSRVTHKVGLPNLANKHIMWCKVQSGGIDLPLPLDSCCLVSLCSLDHAKHMQAKYPNYKWVKLPSPIPIHVANDDAGLQGIGMQDVRIDWGPGKFSIHTMLVVPKLSFPVLFGNNHLELCDAVVSHKDRVVHFRYPKMQFKIKCPSEPPRRPNGTVETNVISLFVHSEKPQKLQHGINFVTLCLSLIFLSGFSPMSSMRNPGMVTDLTALNQYISGYGDNFWLTHSDKFVSDDLFVVPGPLTLKDLPKYTVGIQQNTHTVNVKCHSSRPIVDAESTDDLTIEPTTKVYFTVALYNRSITPQTLPSGIIGDIHVSDNDTATKFQTAATDTAEQLAKNVTAFLSSQAGFHQKASQTSLLYHTASIEFVLEQATGGNNFIRVVGVSPVPLFNLDRLGGKYAIGEISFVPNDNHAYEILPYDRKSKKSSWDKSLFPIIIDGQGQICIVPANLIKAKITLHNHKISREGMETLERSQLLLVYFAFSF